MRFNKQWIEGIGFTFLIASFGYGAAQIPGLNRIGSMACSIIIAVLIRQIWGYPERIRSGIEFSSQKLLRWAIALFGLQLNVSIIFHQGLSLLALDIFSIVFALAVTLLIAKWFKSDFLLSLLLAVGTGVCGASAIAAVSPIVKAKEEDTAISVTIISLIGTIFAITYTLIRPYLPLSDSKYGTWAGISLHEIAQVVLAGSVGHHSLAIAMLAKLGRVFLLIPLSFILLFWMKKRTQTNEETSTKTTFPWFLIGFIIMSLIGSYVIGPVVNVPQWFLSALNKLSHFLLTAAMVGLGLNVSFQAIRSKALRPLITVAITSVLLSVITFFSLVIF